MSTGAALRHALLAALLAAPLALAQPKPADDPVLIENGAVQVRRSDYEHELLRLPPDLRPGFANNPKRVYDLLGRMLVTKAFAAQAKDEKLERDPENAARLAAETERMMAQFRVQEIEQKAGAEFDGKRPQYEARARELYKVDAKKYAVPEQISASHILFDLRKHSREEGERLAREARARVVRGEDFAKVAKELSEDPSAQLNGGRLDWFGKSDMDPAFADAAFALKSVGDVSEPVLSRFGWHIVRLEGRRPAIQKTFEEVREQIMGELRQAYVNERRDAAIAALMQDPKLARNDAAIEALIARPDTEALRRLTERNPVPGVPSSVIVPGGAGK